MLYQNGDPVEDCIVGAVEVQNVQILRIQRVAVGKAVAQRGDGPFFRQILTFRAVKAQTEIIIFSAKPKFGRFYDLLGAMEYCNDSIQLVNLPVIFEIIISLW